MGLEWQRLLQVDQNKRKESRESTGIPGDACDLLQRPCLRVELTPWLQLVENRTNHSVRQPHGIGLGCKHTAGLFMQKQQLFGY